MKKILLLCSVILTFVSSEAQTKKHRTGKSSKKQISTQARIQARIDSLQAQRQLRIDSSIVFQVKYDSIRRMNDSLADVRTQQERMAWKEAKERETDSLNKEQGKLLLKQQEQSLAIQAQRNELNKSAKLNTYQKQQVDYINQSFYNKAQKIKEDASIGDEKKKEELGKLNDERKTKLKTLIGKGKEKKFEKARKAHNNSNDNEVQWIYEADGVVKN